MTKFLNISTDGTLAGNSDSTVVSEKAIKTYVDGSIPTVNNATITITQGGVTKGSFTLNQASGDTIALDAGGGGVGNIDNLTITENASQEIQAVATVNANSAAGATNPIYDWVGTMAEYEAQAVATTHPDWVCYITDDIGGNATDMAQLAEDLNDKVDKGHEVIAFQAPNAGNNYTWYRKYADDWVEQGGYIAADTTGNVKSIALPIEMLDGNYQTSKTLSRCASTTSGFNWGYFGDKSSGAPLNTSTTAYFSVPSTSYCIGAWWQVSGMSA